MSYLIVKHQSALQNEQLSYPPQTNRAKTYKMASTNRCEVTASFDDWKQIQQCEELLIETFEFSIFSADLIEGTYFSLSQSLKGRIGVHTRASRRILFFWGSDQNSAASSQLYCQDMNKVQALVLLGLCLAVVAQDSKDSSQEGSKTFLTSVPVPKGRDHATLFDVWPAVDGQLKAQFWYYLRGANPLYEASIDSPLEYLFFTVYRNSVGTFLVSTSWDKATQVTKINSFVRLGNGYDSTANGKIYDPVLIDPFVVSIALAPNEFMVQVNRDGSVVVTGNKTLYEREKNGGGDVGKAADHTFNVTSDIAKKVVLVDNFNREQYWYYLNNSTVIAQTSIATNDQYYFVFIYVNPIGTFFALSHWSLDGQKAGINTLVRLGDGIPIGENYGPVNLSPAVLKLQTLN